MGRSCILDSPARQVDARGSADACLSWQKVQGREANRRPHRLTEPTTKALCQPPPPLTRHFGAGKGLDHGSPLRGRNPMRLGTFHNDCAP